MEKTNEESLTEALVNACSAADASLAKDLLARGADPNAFHVEDRSAAGHLGGFSGPDTGLGFLSALCLSAGAPPQARVSPLMAAAASGDETTIALLLEAGADPNLPASFGQTPLMAAAAMGRRAAIALLAAASAEIGAKEGNGWNALHIAAAMGQCPSISGLEKAGAALEWRSGEGLTALHIAAVFGQAHACALLVDLRADPDAADPAGRRPVDFARRSNSRHAAEAIEKRSVLCMLAATLAQDLGKTPPVAALGAI